MSVGQASDFSRLAGRRRMPTGHAESSLRVGFFLRIPLLVVLGLALSAKTLRVDPPVRPHSLPLRLDQEQHGHKT